MSGDAQQGPPKSLGSTQASADEISVYPLEFKESESAINAQASELLAYPMACSPNGVPFADEIVSPKTMERQIVSLDPKGGHVFSLKSVPDLHDLRLISFFPSDSSVAFLVTATSDSNESTLQVRIPNGDLQTVHGNFGEHHYYVILFDREGNYQSKVELPGSFSSKKRADREYWKIALYPSGEFLLLDFNSVNGVAELHIFGADGRSIRSIDIPDQMTKERVLVEGADGGSLERSKASSSLSLWQFAASGKNVVLYQPNVRASLLELGASGHIREVPVSSPTGYTLDALISGSGRWIASFRKEGISFDKAVDSGPQSNNFQLYELNPLDGSLKTHLDQRDADFSFGIACESDGILTAIRLGDNSKFVELRANLPR